jgi:hypothetical protein
MRKVESLSMILRLIRRFGGISVQPRLSLPQELTDGLSVIALEGGGIAVEWHSVSRPDAGDDVLDLIDAIRRLLS